jgi:hypothetical protein
MVGDQLARHPYTMTQINGQVTDLNSESLAP